MKAEFIKDCPMKLLLEDHYFDYRGQVIKVPAGFAFDGPSVPRFFSFILEPNNNNDQEAGMEHDFLYSKLSGEINRNHADIHFMGKLCPLLTRICAYVGVRIGGWYSFKKDRNYQKYKDKIEEARKRLLGNTDLGKAM